jgi:MoxR-like ATPase
VDEVRIQEFQNQVRQVHVVESVRRYILNLVHATREHPALALGSSPRGSLALFRTAQAHAALRGRGYAIPDDVKHMAMACLAHRMVMNPENILSGENTSGVVRQLLKKIEVPIT